MMNLKKRSLLVGAAAALAGVRAMAAARTVSVQEPREQIRQTHFPNVALLTHTGKEVAFYDDVLKNQKVVINFMYTACTDVCSSVTQNIREAQRLLGEFANDIHFYSISLTPLHDDPQALRNYMSAQKVGRGWTFLTGKEENIERVRRGLGFVQQSSKEDANIFNHSGMLRIGNERMGSWAHASAVTSGKAIARMIRFELV